MKRRRFLTTLGLLQSLLTLSCKADRLPTIITGKVTDEKGIPIENITFSFKGYDSSCNCFIYTGGTGTQKEIFNLETVSDKNGNFNFSQVVQGTTNEIYLSIINFNLLDNDIKSKKNGVIVGDHDIIAARGSGLTLGVTNDYQITITKK